MAGSEETTAEKVGLNGSTETTGINNNTDSFEKTVNEIVSGTETNKAPENNEAPYGINKKTGQPKKRPYPDGVKRSHKRKKGSRRKPFNTKTVDSSSAKTEKPESVDTGGGEDEYKKYKQHYEDSLDPDAKDEKGDDSLFSDPTNIPAANVVEKPKPKFGSSLVVITQFVLPVLCTLSARLISRNKKKPESKEFRMDEFEKEMLRELADDGAGEEMLGGANKSMVYIIVALALGANKTMDYWDRDESEAQTRAFDEMRDKFEALEKKYNELTKDSEKSPIEI